MNLQQLHRLVEVAAAKARDEYVVSPPADRDERQVLHGRVRGLEAAGVFIAIALDSPLASQPALVRRAAFALEVRHSGAELADGAAELAYQLEGAAQMEEAL